MLAYAVILMRTYVRKFLPKHTLQEIRFTEAKMFCRTTLVAKNLNLNANKPTGNINSYSDSLWTESSPDLTMFICQILQQIKSIYDSWK